MRARLLGFDASERGRAPARRSRCPRHPPPPRGPAVQSQCRFPSDRVKGRRFGACLMAEPELVAQGVAAIEAPAHADSMTVKCRISGGSQEGSRGRTRTRPRASLSAPARTRLIGARPQGLAQRIVAEGRTRDIRRSITAAHQLKPHLPMCPSSSMAGSQRPRHLDHVDGVMLGRAACREPCAAARWHPELFGEPRRTRR